MNKNNNNIQVKAYNDRLFSKSPRLKREDIRLGMQVIGYQLDEIYDTYITLDNAFLVTDRIHCTDYEGVITRISDKHDGWRTSNNSMLIYNDSIVEEYNEGLIWTAF